MGKDLFYFIYLFIYLFIIIIFLNLFDSICYLPLSA